jgi:DNA-binding transcriptional ArsR family regulator
MLSLDSIFSCLADPIRRSILERVAREEELTIGEIAKPYHMTFAGIAKHLKILEQAKLIIKRRRGREQCVQLAPKAFNDATVYLRHYEQLWNNRLDSLETYLSTFPK